ncbi:hypothetical protein SAMN02745121_03281 [Nannocystis exedens]|uniref:Uncharacterized protein n=1 Tax=Nannocystis exedens TaxID=54 RepID=A0A1I1YCB3_9BACT|nr:hypothetical protein [Nannocystis exedens]PCC71931.1 hypothetical protein NAEX_05010 [Nannocystis exedens]SFE16638.1 hypothetical protein SAMN02745121_03281 [Nannocystis exedens]
MPTAPSAHAARAGVWALLVVLATDLVIELTRRLVPLLGYDPAAGSGSGLQWLQWFGWIDRAEPPLRALLTGLAVVALLRLRRATADAGARAMFLGSGLLMALAVGSLLPFQWMTVRGAATVVEAGGLLRLALVFDRLAVALLLAALWRARRAAGHGVGMAWSFAALLYGLRLALIVGVNVIGAPHGDHAAYVRRAWMLLAFYVTDAGALMATLIAFARLAPREPDAERCAAAASGLDLYFRALVTRVTLLVVGVVVTLAFGLTSPQTRGKLLFAVLAVPLPAVVAQLAGLTRYADAPLKLGRGALGVALVGMSVGLAVEVLTLVLFAELLWSEASPVGFGSRAASLVYVDALQYTGAGSQLVALVAAVALLLSLRRAALGLDAPALARRATALATALLAVFAGSFALLRGLGEALARTPIALFGLGLAALVLGVTVFVRWLRLVEGVAQELRARAKIE